MTAIDVAVGHIPSGLFIVTVPSDNQQVGFLASWVQQVSFDPLLISLSLKEGRPGSKEILDGNIFSINIVGEHNKGILKPFWSGYSPDQNPFDSMPHTITDEGALVLGDARSTVVCQLVSSSKPGDHHLVIAGVKKSILSNPSSSSLSHTRKSGLSY